jgi:hypothetical protein
MNGLSDALTIGIVLALVFGALFFYLYSRISQAEKRVSLSENILLDLKMATENALMQRGVAGYSEDEDEGSVAHAAERVQPVSAPEPLESSEVEEMPESKIPDEHFYKSVMAQAASSVDVVGKDTPLDTQASIRPLAEPNYESMTRKELKALAEQRGVTVGAHAQKKELIDALRRTGGGILAAFPAAGSAGGSVEGFPMDAEGAAEIPSLHQE